MKRGIEGKIPPKIPFEVSFLFARALVGVFDDIGFDVEFEEARQLVP